MSHHRGMHNFMPMNGVLDENYFFHFMLSFISHLNKAFLVFLDTNYIIIHYTINTI